MHPLIPVRHHPVLILALLALGAGTAMAGIVQPPLILTVGNTANCNHNTIQAAINAAPAAGSTVIRISNNVGHLNQALLIQNKNIELRGGYPGCGLAPADPAARTTIQGNGGDSVVFINATGNTRTVILRNLVIRGGGSSDVLTERGGGVRIQGVTRVDIRNTRISDNRSHEGGGIHISGGDAELLLDDGTIIGEASSVPGNRAVANGAATIRGGGIYCSHSSVRIIDARIRANTSQGHGGGLYADVCLIDITPRPAFVDGEGGANGFVTFFENQADQDGGAIYASNGLIEWRSLDLSGRFAGRATGNRAGGRGGALFLTGNAMQFWMRWVRLEGNRSVEAGGAVAVANNARLTFTGTSPMNCNYATCPAIVDSNFESDNLNTVGGAVHVTSGGWLGLSQTVLARNVGAAGSAILADTEGSRIVLRHVLLHSNFLTLLNNTSAPIAVLSGADADLIHLTMVGNLRPGGILVQKPLSSLLVGGNTTLVNVHNSVFTDDGDVTLRHVPGSPANVIGSCSLSHENTTLGGVTVGNPDYIDPSGSPPLFMPGPSSDALDRCATAETFPMVPMPDLTGFPRPHDLPEIPNGAGAWDMGAIEAVMIDFGDRIFSNGFEMPIN